MRALNNKTSYNQYLNTWFLDGKKTHTNRREVMGRAEFAFPTFRSYARVARLFILFLKICNANHLPLAVGSARKTPYIWIGRTKEQVTMEMTRKGVCTCWACTVHLCKLRDRLKVFISTDARRAHVCCHIKYTDCGALAHQCVLWFGERGSRHLARKDHLNTRTCLSAKVSMQHVLFTHTWWLCLYKHRTCCKGPRTSLD